MNYVKNIAVTLREAAVKLEYETGLIEAVSGEKFTFGQLEKKSNGYGKYLLEKGVSPGDRVMLMVKPSADFICLTFGLFKIGATIILIDPGMGYKNLLKCIEGVRPDIFIGIPKACLFKSFFPKVFHTVKKTFCCGNSLRLFGKNIQKEAGESKELQIYKPKHDDLAAIIFTTGSTGPPKGVRYEHTIFATQLEYIRSYYKITAKDVDQPAFPLFALFSTALGASAVIPDMDPTRPAQVNPEKFISSIQKYGVTYSFGSPAIWNVVSNFCLEQKITLPSLKKVLMAGAPVPGELIERVAAIIAEDGEIFTPYGATESLPIVSIEGKEIVQSTWAMTRKGKGTCVGRPLPDIEIRVIKISDSPIENIDDTERKDINQIGEIIVKGNVVTKSYENNVTETLSAKIKDGNSFWHRMGDTGYLDESGRLWFCGRKAHRVITAKGTLFTIQCEAIANNHFDVFRSALVGIPDFENKGCQQPVMIIEKKKGVEITDQDVLDQVRMLCKESSLTSDIQFFLIHQSFPVDIRHNAKIFREKLAVWAENEISR